jgi:NAD/NADP transhydrogenase alpha subunit
MKALASMVLLLGGGAVFFASVCYTAAMFPMSAFGGELKELHAGRIGIAVGAVALVIGFLLRRSEPPPEHRDSIWSSEFREKEEDLKRCANDGKL